MEDPSGAKTGEKSLSYTTTIPYATLNEPGPDTKTTWVVFHGIGYLSRFFLRYFRDFDPEKHYFIAPQAPSLYYLTDAYKHIGACWLTREKTGMMMENLLRMLDVLWEDEKLASCDEIRLLGYSQGVSVLSRWVARRKIDCGRIVLYAGRIPDELGPEDFAHLSPQTRVEVLFGTEDPFIQPDHRSALRSRLHSLFGDRLKIHEFEGGHDFHPSLVGP